MSEPAHPERGAQLEGEAWQRLDPRMLLIGPVQVLRQFAVPALIAFVGLSTSQGSMAWYVAVPAILGPITFGLIPWLMTRYRIDGGQLQVRRGLIGRAQVTAPLDRVRSVDLESSLLHRLLGLAKVQIGTGVDETRIELDSLSLPEAERLRHYLLGARATDWSQTADSGPEMAPIGPSRQYQAPPETLANIDWAWLKYAPFSLAKLAIVAGAVGALSQWGDSLPFLDSAHVSAAWQWVLGFAIPLVILSILLAGLSGWLLVSVLGYVISWWDFRLTREHGTIRLTAGAFTTRSTSVEEARVRGVALSEPVLLRLVKGGDLFTLATGVGSGGITKILPPCPREVCLSVGEQILRTDVPLTSPLVPHGPGARRRCLIRALRPALLIGLAAAALSVWGPLSALAAAVITALALAWAWVAGSAEYRHLGHLLTHHHLVAGYGVLERSRTALERDGVIGWVVKQTFFQRRRGLATLVATTAAGAESVLVRDLPLTEAISLAAAVTPEAVEPFLAAPA